MKNTFLFLLITLSLLAACQYDKITIIEKEFEPFVENFRTEANLRSVDVDDALEEITILFGDIEDPKVSGTCNRTTDIITIDSTSWKRLDFERKEHLIFHELGHCVLDILHREEQTTSGDCHSYMRSSSGLCSVNYYSTLWRKYYFDELFADITSIPSWYDAYENYADIAMDFEHLFQIEDTLAEEIKLDDINFNSFSRFLFEMEFENWNTDENLVQYDFGDLTFKSCNPCARRKIELCARPPNQLQKTYYSNDDIRFESNIKLSMYKDQEIVYFYVNEQFVHAMNFDQINGNQIISGFSGPSLNMHVYLGWDE